MKYRNEKTGAVIDSPCTISGGDWVEIVQEEKKEKKETKKKK